MASYDFIEYAVDSGIAEVLLDRPDVLNAFHHEMIDELATALNAAQEDDRVYALVLSGNGRGFCSGADVTNMGGERDRVADSARLWKVQEIVRQLYFGRKPTVAAVNGPAIGAGCDFALACDLRVLSEDGFLREQFVNIGLVPGDGGGWLLPRLIGESKAKEYILTARDITPAAALDLGLAVDVVPPDDLLDAAHDLAAEIRDKPAAAVQETKALIDGAQSYEDYSQAAIEAQWRVRNDPEHHEAVAAFKERRDPDYDRTY